MTDELTPEERDALRQLPRERMPSAGLEERVVGAMRHRGILAPKQRGKVVRLTTGRVAGLLAASVVLVAGAYYIGQRGVGDDVILTTTTPQSEISQMNELGRAVPRREPEPGAVPDAAPKETEAPATLPAPAEEIEMQAMAEEKKELEWSLKDADRTEAADAVQETARESVTEGLAAQSNERVETRGGRSDQPPAPAAKMFSAAPAPELVASAASADSFQLGFASLIVNAPESVEVTEDEENTTLVINSSGSLVRIRPADVVTALNSRPKAQYKPLGTVTRSYQIGTSRFEVDAPAGVRVVEDRKGGMLLIYTSDGIVRIRLAN